MYMTQGEMIEYIRSHPYELISHVLFDDDEYVYLAKDGKVYDENGYLFEDWEWKPFARNGLRIRDFGPWKSGWFVKTGVPLNQTQK